MILTNLNPVQERIIRHVCEEQINSYHELALHGHPEFDELAKRYPGEETESIIVKYLIDKKTKFEKAKADPSKVLTILDEMEMMNFFYTLTRLDEVYREKFPKSVLGLWKQLYIGENMQTNKFEFLN